MFSTTNMIVHDIITSMKIVYIRKKKPNSLLRNIKRKISMRKN